MESKKIYFAPQMEITVFDTADGTAVAMLDSGREPEREPAPDPVAGNSRQ
ncbi:MAG: hypothetical protein K6F56_08065 [Oscillospiraceae bacterium]|nr:hypothetical protein [Oscillospiraceae bacterium]